MPPTIGCPRKRVNFSATTATVSGPRARPARASATAAFASGYGRSAPVTAEVTRPHSGELSTPMPTFTVAPSPLSWPVIRPISSSVSRISRSAAATSRGLTTCPCCLFSGNTSSRSAFARQSRVSSWSTNESACRSSRRSAALTSFPVRCSLCRWSAMWDVSKRNAMERNDSPTTRASSISWRRSCRQIVQVRGMSTCPSPVSSATSEWPADP